MSTGNTGKNVLIVDDMLISRILIKKILDIPGISSRGGGQATATRP